MLRARGCAGSRPAVRKSIDMSEVAKHNTTADCWLVIRDTVYNVTAFIHDHPGGVQLIADWAGKDATVAFSSIHSTEVLSMLDDDALIGQVNTASIQPQHRTAHPRPASSSSSSASSSSSTTVSQQQPGTTQQTRSEVANLKADMRADGAVSSAPTSDPIRTIESSSFHPPPVSNCLNIADLEAVCRSRMGKEGLDYYTSAADDEITLRENRSAFQRVFLIPRVLVNVKSINLTTTLLGSTTAMPLYITACALGKLAHPDGECALTRAAGKHGIIQMCPTLGSCTIEEMAAARITTTTNSTDNSLGSPTQWFQLYVNANRNTTLSLIRRAESAGMKALCITVDAPVLGRRERDMRNKMKSAPPSAMSAKTGKGNSAGSAGVGSGGVARSITQFIDPSLSWSDLDWFQKNTKLPIVLKGIQCTEDALLAVQYGVAGIVISNHGGRQLDCARSGIEMLVDICDTLRTRNLLNNKLEIYMDGGVRRGSDIFKALAVGARAVGIGRPALFGLGAYGQEGVERCLELLKEELLMTMMLMGCPTLADIRRNSVITSSLSAHVTAVPVDHLAQANYQPLSLAVAQSRL